MRGKYYTDELKKKVELLRANGKTYGQLTASFGVPKSTLSCWLGKKYPGVFDKEARLVHLANIRKLAQNRLNIIKLEKQDMLEKRVNNDFKKFPLDNPGYYKSILAALYWAEGSKHDKVYGLKFANTDPKMMALYINYLRKIYIIDESKFRLKIHIHYYHKKREIKKFWSQLLKIPEKQFWKTYVKKRSKTKKFRRNFMGICFLYYPESDIRKELLEICNNLHNLIA